MSRNVVVRFTIPLLIVFLAGCTTAPKETVELAEIVDRQTAELQTSHERFVRLYYAGLRDEVDEFMRDKWIPQFLSNVIEGTGDESRRFREQLDMGYKLATLDWQDAVNVDRIQDGAVRKAAQGAIERLAMEEQSSLGLVLLDFSNAVQVEINKRRASLIQPIDEQEALVLDRLRSTYADVQRGNASIKGYLASVVELVEQRDSVLQKIGALEAQQNIVNLAVQASDGAAAALQGAGTADAGIEGFLAELDKFKAIFD